MKATQSTLTISWFIIGLIWLGTGSTQADTSFFDDFSDGSVTNDVPVATDGTPVRWMEDPLNLSSTTLDASSGDLIMSTDGAFAVGFAEQFNFANTSIRTQFRRINNTDVIGVGSRGSLTSINGYSAGFGSLGGMFISIVSDSGTEVLKAVPTDLNPTDEEVILQFDAIDNTLKLWAWRPGEPMPPIPQVSVTDSVYTQGPISLFVGTQFGDRRKEGTFRYVHAADMHIPEPTTILLAMFGLTSVCCYRRRR